MKMILLGLLFVVNLSEGVISNGRRKGSLITDIIL